MAPVMQIDKELITKVSEKLNKANTQTAQLCSQRFRHEQPSLFDFLAAVGEQSFNDSEKEWLFYLTILVNEVYLEQFGKLGQISHDALELEASKILSLAANMENKGADEFLEVTSKIKQNNRQTVLIDYIISALNVASELETKNIRRTSVITIFLFLVIVLNSYQKLVNADAV